MFISQNAVPKCAFCLNGNELKKEYEVKMKNSDLT